MARAIHRAVHVRQPTCHDSRAAIRPDRLQPYRSRLRIDTIVDSLAQSGCSELIEVSNSKAKTLERPNNILIYEISSINWKSDINLHSENQSRFYLSSTIASFWIKERYVKVFSILSYSFRLYWNNRNGLI